MRPLEPASPLVDSEKNPSEQESAPEAQNDHEAQAHAGFLGDAKLDREVVGNQHHQAQDGNLGDGDGLRGGQRGITITPA